jgi:hypothetical protein
LREPAPSIKIAGMSENTSESQRISGPHPHEAQRIAVAVGVVAAGAGLMVAAPPFAPLGLVVALGGIAWTVWLYRRELRIAVDVLLMGTRKSDVTQDTWVSLVALQVEIAVACYVILISWIYTDELAKMNTPSKAITSVFFIKWAVYTFCAAISSVLYFWSCYTDTNIWKRRAVAVAAAVTLFVGAPLASYHLTGTEFEVKLIPRSHDTEKPAAVHTSAQILFGPLTTTPKTIASQNIEWRAIERTASVRKYTMANTILGADPEASECMMGSMANKCFSSYKYLEMVISFTRPITYKTLKIVKLQGENVPKWKQVIMTETDAVISFDYYPSNTIMEVEATD